VAGQAGAGGGRTAVCVRLPAVPRRHPALTALAPARGGPGRSACADAYRGDELVHRGHPLLQFPQADDERRVLAVIQNLRG
jgi:hypothetical protein